MNLDPKSQAYIEEYVKESIKAAVEQVTKFYDIQLRNLNEHINYVEEENAKLSERVDELSLSLMAAKRPEIASNEKLVSKVNEFEEKEVEDINLKLRLQSESAFMNL